MISSNPPQSDPTILKASPQAAEAGQIDLADLAQPAKTETGAEAAPDNPYATEDQASTQCFEAHGSAANSVCFEEPETQAVTEPEPQTRPRDSEVQQALFTEKGEAAGHDPGVQALLDYVREQENKNIQALLDMLQQSLDRAHEQMEENKRHFYAKVLPQMQQLEQSLQNDQANQAAGDQQLQTQRAQQTGKLVQALQNQLAQAGPAKDPLLQQISAELAVIQQRVAISP